MTTATPTAPTTTTPVTREQALAKARAILVRRGIGDPTGGLANHLADEAMKVQARNVTSAQPGTAGTRGMATEAGGPQRGLTDAERRIIRSVADVAAGDLVALDADRMTGLVKVPYLTGRWRVQSVDEAGRYLLARVGESDAELAERRDVRNSATLSRARLAELRVPAYSRLALVIREVFGDVDHSDSDWTPVEEPEYAGVARFQNLDLDDDAPRITVRPRGDDDAVDASIERFRRLDLGGGEAIRIDLTPTRS